MSAGNADLRWAAGGSRLPRKKAPPRVAVVTAAVLAGAGLALTAGSSPAASHPAGSVVAAGNPAVQLQGRWDRSPWADTTVNSGSRLFLRFTGHRIAAMIAANPRGAEFFSRIDGGPPVLHIPGGAAGSGEGGGGGYGTGGSYGMDGAGYGVVNLASRPLAAGVHTVEIDVKDVDGGGDRWSPPLRSAFILYGFLLDRGARTVPLPAVQGPRMLFVGDSITEGIRAAGPQVGPAGADATDDYAWLTGRAFGADFSQVGFGGQGIFHRGDGDVPPAPVTLRYNYRGSPASGGFVPQVVVVSQGTNDERVRSARFEPAYLRYLRQIRAAWPAAWIFALRPFSGTHAADIAAAVKAEADPRTEYVDTAGWLRPEEFTDGLHPSLAGHMNAARRLEAVIAHVTGWRFRPTAAAVCQLLPVGQAGATVTAAGSQAQRAGSGSAAGRAGAASVASSRPRRGGSGSGSGSGSVAGVGAVRVGFRHPIPLPSAARDLFLYVSVPGRVARSYEVRLTVSGRRAARTVTVPGIPVFHRFLPWARIHIGLGGWHGPLTGFTIEVRGDGTGRESLPFLVTGAGWTNQPDG